MTTILELLYESSASAVADIVGKLPLVRVDENHADIAEAITGFLQMPLDELLHDGWEATRAVGKAMKSTANKPDARESVTLKNQSRSTSQRLQLLIDAGPGEKRLLDLVLEVELALAYLTLAIEGGAVKRVRPGSAKAAAALSVAAPDSDELHEIRRAEMQAVSLSRDHANAR